MDLGYIPGGAALNFWILSHLIICVGLMDERIMHFCWGDPTVSCGAAGMGKDKHHRETDADALLDVGLMERSMHLWG